MRSYRGPLLIGIITFSLFAYMYLIPPYTEDLLQLPLSGDLSPYLSRFMLSFVFLGLIPFVSAMSLGFSFREIGFVWRRGMMKYTWYWLLLITAVVAIVPLAFHEGLSRFYPYSRTILQMSLDGSIGYFILHLFMYAILFYLPWDMLFRGIMILPFVYYYERITSADLIPETGRRMQFVYPSADEKQLNSWKDPALLTVAVLQIFPTAILHLSHPLIESMGSIAMGFVAAIIVLRTRSFIPVLFLHAITGIMLDTLILLRMSTGI